MNLLFQIWEIIKTPLSQTINQAGIKVGLPILATGGSVAVAEHNHIIEQGTSIAEWVLVVTLITGILLTVKLGLDIAISYKKLKGD
jgi:hypothetical protein